MSVEIERAQRVGSAAMGKPRVTVGRENSGVASAYRIYAGKHGIDTSKLDKDSLTAIGERLSAELKQKEHIDIVLSYERLLSWLSQKYISNHDVAIFLNRETKQPLDTLIASRITTGKPHRAR